MAALKELVEAGMIEIEHRFRDNGGQTSNLYTVYDQPLNYTGPPKEEDNSNYDDKEDYSIYDAVSVIGNYSAPLYNNHLLPSENLTAENLTAENLPPSKNDDQCLVPDSKPNQNLVMVSSANDFLPNQNLVAVTSANVYEVLPNELNLLEVRPKEEREETLLAIPKETAPPSAPSPSNLNDDQNIKTPYGEHKNILLTKNEYEKLVATYGEKLATTYINKIDCYLVNSKYKYNNHYAKLCEFLIIDGYKEINAEGKPESESRQQRGRSKYANITTHVRDYEELERKEQQLLIKQAKEMDIEDANKKKALEVLSKEEILRKEAQQKAEMEARQNLAYDLIKEKMISSAV